MEVTEVIGVLEGGFEPFWAMFAEFDLDELSRIPFGLPLMWVYVLIANIVLVNMCVAPAPPSISLRTNTLRSDTSLPPSPSG